MQARTAVDRSSMFRIGASDITSKTPIRVRLHPLAARAEASRHGASLRLRGVSLPRASNARMLRERDAIAFDPVIPLCERQNENAPGCWNPRAFAWPREIGVTDLRDGEGSVDAGGAEGIPLAVFGQQRIAPFARAQSRIALGRCRIGVDVEGEGHGIHEWKNRRLAKVAHLTRMFFVWQRNFYITDERSSSSAWWWRACMRHSLCARCADDAAAMALHRAKRNPPCGGLLLKG